MEKVVTSQINGEFKGCEGHSVYEFTNGQVWEQSRYRYRYVYRYRPQVTVWQNGGEYLLEVDGMDDMIEVRRKR